MKKIFNSLIIATITFGSIPNLVANSPHETQVNKKNIQPIILHYDSGIEIFNDWGIKNENWRILYTFNLQTVNPSQYKKIKFLGKDSDFYTRISWGNTPYYGTKLNFYNKSVETSRNNEISYKLVNAKIIDPNINGPKVLKYKDYFLLQNFFRFYENFWGDISTIHGIQRLFFTWYFENGNYYLQILSYYKVNVTNSNIGGGTFLGIGTGIELYND